MALYPQSNGFTERVVQTVKKNLQKVKQSKINCRMALLRSTPLDNYLPSPAEILYGRKIRTRNQRYPKDNQIRNRVNINNKKQQQYYNMNAKDLPIDNKVLVLQENDTWLPVTVIDKCTEPRSHIIEMQND